MILLDTHVLLWLAAEPSRLSRTAAAAIRRALRSGGIAIASISLWEIAVLFAKGRLRSRGTIEASVEEILRATGVTLVRSRRRSRRWRPSFRPTSRRIQLIA